MAHFKTDGIKRDSLTSINKIREELGLPLKAADPRKLERERARRANLARRAEESRALKAARNSNKKG